MRKTTTKRALLASVMALFLCFTMLLGTTFAWFTDTASSEGNKIVAGSLDIKLLLYKDGAYTDISENSNPIFGDGAIAEDSLNTKWEPGKTQVAYLAIENAGNLDLKYTVRLNVKDYTLDLYKVMQYAITPDAMGTDAEAPAWDAAKGIAVVPGVQDASAADVTLEQGKTHYFALSLHMLAEATDEYQKGEITFDISVLATQLASESDSFGNEYDSAAGTAFVGGNGTAESPYLVNEASQLLSISDHYDEYTYFKVADGVKTLDLTGVGNIKLNGSFDGNGVEITGLTTALFEFVGKVGDPQDIKISNFTATVNTTDGRALVKNINNSGTTTFENVALHGYIEGEYNMGSFYNYGTANNTVGSDGANYTVSFVNATSDVTLVCTTGNAIGGMLGHGFEGANYKVSINMDDASGYTGKMYTTGTAKCYEVMAMCSHTTYILNGVEVSRYDNEYPSTKLTVVAPTVGADGYYAAPADGVDHYVVSLNSQLTAYDENGVKIPNKAGMTWVLGEETITEGLDGKIFDLVESAVIVNGEDHEFGYELNNGVLTIYSGRPQNYASGWITLYVNQYDADGNVLATGNIRVYTFAEPNS